MINFSNLFVTIGHLGGLLNSVNTYRGTTVPSLISTIYSTYEGEGLEAVVDGFMSTQSSWQSSCGSINTALQSLAQTTLITVVNNDVLQPDNTLATAMGELIVQMQSGSQTVEASSVGISGTATSGNDGNPVFVYSTKTSNGLTLENLFAESITGTVTQDSQTGGVSAGSEVISWSGQQALTDRMSYSWPQGSGCTLSTTVVNAANNEPGGFDQWLANGDFETWTVSNVPDSWHITVGTAGTQVLKGTSAYTGTYSLALVGDGTTLTALEQQFGVDNSNTIQPMTQYCVNMWIKASAVPASGVLEVARVRPAIDVDLNPVLAVPSSLHPEGLEP